MSIGDAAGSNAVPMTDEEHPYLVPLSFGDDEEPAPYFVFLLFGTESRKGTVTGTRSVTPWRTRGTRTCSAPQAR